MTRATTRMPAATAALQRAITALLRGFRRRRPLRAGSLVMTVFGDAIAPRGGNVWLGDLIALLEPFGLNHRLVRTTVFRLTGQKWLAARRLGRRSYYSLTVPGREMFEQATRRIYSTPAQAWDGQWTWLLLAPAPAAERTRLRRELEWLGFGVVSRDLLAHPHPQALDLTRQLENLGTAGAAIAFRGAATGLNSPAAVAELVRRCWDLDGLETRYLGFLRQFQPVFEAARRVRPLPPELAFQLRTLLIHEYRKLLLRDPHLPAALLPPHWPGGAAFELCRQLYRLVLPATETHLSRQLAGIAGPLPPADRALQRRFGGLRRQSKTAAGQDGAGYDLLTFRVANVASAR